MRKNVQSALAQFPEIASHLRRWSMPIPDFQSLMLPIMKIAGDGAEHRGHELRQRIGERVGLTEEERKQLLPSGTQAVFTNRIAWARTHLTMAGPLEKTVRRFESFPSRQYK